MAPLKGAQLERAEERARRLQKKIDLAREKKKKEEERHNGFFKPDAEAPASCHINSQAPKYAEARYSEAQNNIQNLPLPVIVHAIRHIPFNDFATLSPVDLERLKKKYTQLSKVAWCPVYHGIANAKLSQKFLEEAAWVMGAQLGQRPSRTPPSSSNQAAHSNEGQIGLTGPDDPSASLPPPYAPIVSDADTAQQPSQASAPASPPVPTPLEQAGHGEQRAGNGSQNGLTVPAAGSYKRTQQSQGAKGNKRPKRSGPTLPAQTTPADASPQTDPAFVPSPAPLPASTASPPIHAPSPPRPGLPPPGHSSAVSIGTTTYDDAFPSPDHDPSAASLTSPSPYTPTAYANTAQQSSRASAPAAPPPAPAYPEQAAIGRREQPPATNQPSYAPAFASRYTGYDQGPSYPPDTALQHAQASQQAAPGYDQPQITQQQVGNGSQIDSTAGWPDPAFNQSGHISAYTPDPGNTQITASTWPARDRETLADQSPAGSAFTSSSQLVYDQHRYAGSSSQLFTGLAPSYSGSHAAEIPLEETIPPKASAVNTTGPSTAQSFSTQMTFEGPLSPSDVALRFTVAPPRTASPAPASPILAPWYKAVSSQLTQPTLLETQQTDLVVAQNQAPAVIASSDAPPPPIGGSTLSYIPTASQKAPAFVSRSHDGNIQTSCSNTEQPTGSSASWAPHPTQAQSAITNDAFQPSRQQAPAPSSQATGTIPSTEDTIRSQPSGDADQPAQTPPISLHEWIIPYSNADEVFSKEVLDFAKEDPITVTAICWQSEGFSRRAFKLTLRLQGLPESGFKATSLREDLRSNAVVVENTSRRLVIILHAMKNCKRVIRLFKQAPPKQTLSKQLQAEQ